LTAARKKIIIKIKLNAWLESLHLFKFVQTMFFSNSGEIFLFFLLLSDGYLFSSQFSVCSSQLIRLLTLTLFLNTHTHTHANTHKHTHTHTHTQTRTHTLTHPKQVIFGFQTWCDCSPIGMKIWKKSIKWSNQTKNCKKNFY